MAYANFETREIHCKILYVGAKGSGKTENLKSIYHKTQVRLTHEPMTFEDKLNAPFEFIPLSIGQLKDFHVKLHIYTLPEHNLYPTFNMVVTRGIDGLVFVVDSSLSALQDNIDAWVKLKETLTQEGYNLSALPRVLQYNKRDEPDALTLEALRSEFNTHGLADVEAVATQHLGTMETVQKISGLVLDELGKS
ncbi:MAG: gliding-motility protein MglA [Chitinophagaceae bacterium]|nr:gliding-motility protein MglA [Oligoflexus sp.]